MTPRLTVLVPRKNEKRPECLPLPLPILFVLAAALAWSIAPTVRAADLRIEVSGLRSTDGQLLIAVCPRAAFTTSACPYSARGTAADGRVTVRGVPPGIYAVQGIHDENGDGMLNQRGLTPAEGIAFSRDAPIRRGPPRFDDAAVDVRASGTIYLTMRYFR